MTEFEGTIILLVLIIMGVLVAAILSSFTFSMLLEYHSEFSEKLSKIESKLVSEIIDLKGKTDHIAAVDERIEAKVDEKIAPQLRILVDDMNYQKGVRSNGSDETDDAVISIIKACFDENAKLNRMMSEQAEEIGKLKGQNQALEKQLAGYKKRDER